MSAAAVSVVIPCFNASRFLAEAVESVLAQSFRRWELLLIDDGSTDASASVARRLAGREPGRIRCLRHPFGSHRGAFASRLLGARRARAPVLALLDADDVWEPDYLRRHLLLWRRLAPRKIALSYGPALYWFPQAGGDFAHAMPASRETVFGPGELLQNFLSSGYATVPRTSASLIRRDAFLKAAHFAPFARRMPYFEDQFLMWDLAARWPVAAHPHVWVRYRQRSPIAARPRSTVLGNLRDERSFLPIMRDYLARRLPRHPLLGPGGLPARMAALRRGLSRDYFFRRIPEDLRVV